MSSAVPRAALEQCIDEGAPVIVSLDRYSHWAVVYGYGLGGVFLADPSVLRAPLPWLPWKTFRARWTGTWGLAVSER